MKEQSVENILCGGTILTPEAEIVYSCKMLLQANQMVHTLDLVYAQCEDVNVLCKGHEGKQPSNISSIFLSSL